MAKIENCDVVVGEGSTKISAGAYKVGEGDKQETRYKFGILINLPTFTQELIDKLIEVGKHRVMSVKAAGTFNKANNFGTKEDAEAFARQFSTIEGWTEAFEKVRREGGAPKIDSHETRANKYLADVLRTKMADGSLAKAKVTVVGIESPPKTEKGVINYIAWAKLNHEHPWYQMALKKTETVADEFK